MTSNTLLAAPSAGRHIRPYMAAGGLPRGVTQPDNGLATSGPGQCTAIPAGGSGLINRVANPAGVAFWKVENERI
jgi:hypothetical protein